MVNQLEKLNFVSQANLNKEVLPILNKTASS